MTAEPPLASPRLRAPTPAPAPAEPPPQPSPPPPRPPADRVYTGGDLARFRAERGLTQRAAAEQLGVAHGTVAKAELDQTRELGQALQAAMRRVCGS